MPEGHPEEASLPSKADTGADSPDLAMASSLEGHLLQGRFLVEGRIAAGGMALVYRGTDTKTESPVAIKILLERYRDDPDAVERLRREALLAGKFDHANLCPILAHGEVGETPYLVMPLLDGETLDRRETRLGRLPLAEGIPVLRQIADGMERAHTLGILHRDLKPENVMLVGEGADTRAVVMDFGLAAVETMGALERLTATGIVLGTPEFMSPEQIRGQPLDRRSDIYALGVLAFEMFTGDLPFEGESAQEVMMHHLTGPARSLRATDATLPANLERLVARLLATRPADRYQTMGEVSTALRSISAPPTLSS